MSVLSIMAALLGSSVARAEPDRSDLAAAEALYTEGRKLVEAGDYAAGCPKFEASLALYPSSSTMINIARCHEHDGKIAAAWADYSRALALNAETQGEERRKSLAEIATKGISALAPRLPKLRVVIPGAPAGLKVVRDGKELPAAALGEALPVDPGPHEVSVSAPGYRTETRSLSLAEGKTTTVEIALSADGAAQAPAPSGKEAPPGPQGGVPAWVWVTGGAGVLLAGAGVYFLTDDLAAISALKANCHVVPPDTYCAPGYAPEHDNARKNRDLGLSLGLGGAGVVALGAAVAGLVLSPPARPPGPPRVGVSAAPWGAPGGGGVLITGSF